jgi:hypothetical protein
MKVFLLIVQLVPALISLIKAIEEALPAAGLGAEKLAAIRKILEAAFEGASEVWPVVEKVISVIVSLFNNTGVFSTKTPA